MNYANEVIEHLDFMLPSLSAMEQQLLQYLKVHITKAKKFLLPKNGIVGVTIDEESSKFCHLPFDMMTFEYAYEDSVENMQLKADMLQTSVVGSPKRLALVCKLVDKKAPKKDSEFSVTVFNYNEEFKTWVMLPISAILKEGDIYRCTINGATQYKYEALPVLPSVLQYGMQQMGKNQALQCILSDMYDEIHNAISAIIAMNAKNVSTVTIEAPEKLNKKRIKNNKLPLFDYHVLSIHCGKEVLTKRPRDRIASIMNEIKKGLRLHAVRGHFKRRNGKLFWWRDHLRGKKELGIIEKDYTID